MTMQPSDPDFVRAVTDSVPMAIYHMNANGVLTYGNAEYFAIFGLTPDQNPNDWAQAIHPGDMQLVEKMQSRFVEQHDASGRMEYRIRTRGGEVRHMTEHVVAFTWDGNAGYVSSITDVTELKEAQAQLDVLHGKLVDASRQAGRAEIATSVLHNVGNVLNSVNVSADVVAASVKSSKAGELDRVVRLLEENAGNLGAFFENDERGKRLVGYLGKIARGAADARKQVLEEIAALKSGIDHIKTIVSMQQDYAKLGGFEEPVDITALVEDGVRLNEGSMKRHGVEIRRDYAEIPRIVTDRHKVLQILVNLIRNAKHACEAADRVEKIVTLQLRSTETGVQAVVSDNGVGIAAENMTRIFNHGFTTKQGGHGFGLHSSALAAQELGGKLVAASAGLGCGACFTLDLPSAMERSPP